MVIYHIEPARLAVFCFVWGPKLQVRSLSLGIYDILKADMFL